MKLSERIFISLILAILIFFISLVDINFESHLMISSFAQKEREIIFENYDTRIVSYVDNMTDQKVEYLVLLFDSPIYMAIFRHNDFSIGFYSNYEYLHFSPDATHLIRVGDSTPIPLNYIDKANCLKPKTPEMGDLVISALVKGEEISLRYYMDTQIPVFESPVKQYEQIDTKFQNIFFGFVYHKAATLFGWKDLETSPDLPPVKLNILTPTDPESKVEVTVTIQGNPSILLTKNKERSYASIKVGGREALRFNSNSECVYIDNYMPDYLIIRDLDGKTVFKERLPIGSYIEKPTSYTMLAFGDTRWSEGETAVKKAWETGSLGFIEIEGRKGSLYGFRELWQWGVDNLNFPSIGVDIQAEPVISPGPSLQATDTTKPPQDVLPGRIVWDRTYGGSGYDEAWSLIQTTDGGYAVAGYTSSKGAGGYDAWVIRLDQEGNKVWDKTYGGSQDDGAWSLIQTTDGGYAVAGYTSSKGAGGRDFWVIKLDSQGNIVWDRTYGGRRDDLANSIIQTTDGGFVVAGFTSSKNTGERDACIIKLDSEGNKKWEKTYGGRRDDLANSLIQTTDGGYAVAGYTSSKGAGGRDFWVIKLDSQGNIVWDRTYGGRRDDLANSIIQTTDGGFVVAGFTSPGGGEMDAWIIKLDSEGNKKWEKPYGGRRDDLANSIIQTTDGGFVVAGFTCSKGAGRADAWIIKLDSEGNKKWEKTYGGSMADSINSLIQTIDGGFVVAGFTYSKGAGNSDVWIFKLDRWGNLTPNSEALEVEAEVDATESQLSLTTHPLQGSLHCPDKTGYACLSCLEASGYVNHFKGFNILTTQEDCYVRLVTKDNSSIENHNDCEVIIKGEKWLGLEDESETVLVEEINKGNFEFIPANLFAERTITFPQDGYQYEFADGGKEFRLYLSRNLTEAFKAVPWQNLSVEIKNQETNKVFTYQFEKGIFPRPYTWSTGVANYGQCVWWAANRWVEEVDSQSLFPFYPPPSSDMKGVKSIDSNYQPKQYDIFIDYNPEQASKLGHYAFVEKVEDDLVYITQFNFIPPGEVYNSISRFWSGNPKSLYYSLNPNNEYYFKYYYRD